MRNRFFRTLLSSLLALLIFAAPLCIDFGTQSVSAATKMTLSELKAKFPHNRYWNHLAGKNHKYNGNTHSGQCGDIMNTTTSHPCNKHGDGKVSKEGDYSCNCYSSRTQCCGFATYLGKLAFGTDPYKWSTTTNKTTAMSVVKPGDVIHYYGAGAGPKWGHWVFVTSVSSTAITVGECNYGTKATDCCRINWGRSISKSTLKGSDVTLTLYKAPSELTDRKTTHTFSFNTNGGTGTFSSISVKYGENINLPTAKPERAGYTFVGWNAHRTTDNTWYVGSTGWLTEDEITAKGYEKRLYTTGTYLINDSWTKGLSGNTAYTFTAVWEKNAAPLLTVQSETDINGESLGAFDVYINGKAVKTGVSQFSGAYAVDTAYEIKNVRSDGCYVLSDKAPALSGKLTANTTLMLGFTEKHSYKKAVIKPTCTENGYIEYICAKCKVSYTTEQDGEWSLTKPNAPDEEIEAKTFYRYATDRKTSAAASLSGYEKAGTEWQKTEEGTIDYAEAFPAGFNKSSSLYTKYNAKPKTAAETATQKTTVTTSTAGYIYWHWCYGTYTAGPINRKISSTKTSAFPTFHGFFSTKDVALTASANARQISNASVCKDTYWWLNERVTIKRCSYTQYEKVNVFIKWSDWQDTKPAASGADTGSAVMYRLRVSENLKATGHGWDSGVVTKAATAAADGVKTYTCTVCKATKTESVPKLNNTFLAGDADNDGKISASDARLALRRSVGLEKYAAGSRAFLACDVDKDSKVTAADARLILRAAVGLENPKKW